MGQGQAGDLREVDRSEGTGRADLMVIVKIPKDFGVRFWNQESGPDFDVVRRFIQHPDHAAWGEDIARGSLRRNGFSDEEIEILLPVFMGLKQATKAEGELLAGKKGLWRE